MAMRSKNGLWACSEARPNDEEDGEIIWRERSWGRSDLAWFVGAGLSLDGGIGDGGGAGPRRGHERNSLEGGDAIAVGEEMLQERKRR